MLIWLNMSVSCTWCNARNSLIQLYSRTDDHQLFDREHETNDYKCHIVIPCGQRNRCMAFLPHGYMESALSETDVSGFIFSDTSATIKSDRETQKYFCKYPFVTMWVGCVPF